MAQSRVDVMGGYVTATGVLALTLAVTAFRQRCPGGGSRFHRGRFGLDWMDGRRQLHDQLGLQMGAALICVHLGSKHRSLCHGSAPLCTLRVTCSHGRTIEQCPILPLKSSHWLCGLPHRSENSTSSSSCTSIREISSRGLSRPLDARERSKFPCCT